MIREYREEDLEELLGIWTSASRVAHSFLDEEFFATERKNIREVYLPKAQTWVFERDGRVAGFIALIGNEVGGLFVGAECQRQGIGRALLEHARGLRDHLYLDVFKANEVGRAFYDGYGFEVAEESIHEETGHPQLRMRWPPTSALRAGATRQDRPL